MNLVKSFPISLYLGEDCILLSFTYIWIFTLRRLGIFFSIFILSNTSLFLLLSLLLLSYFVELYYYCKLSLFILSYAGFVLTTSLR